MLPACFISCQAFVGISNWRLDASKMNRALYLARPDPDENDLPFDYENDIETDANGNCFSDADPGL